MDIYMAVLLACLWHPLPPHEVNCIHGQSSELDTPAACMAMRVMLGRAVILVATDQGLEYRIETRCLFRHLEAI